MLRNPKRFLWCEDVPTVRARDLREKRQLARVRSSHEFKSPRPDLAVETTEFSGVQYTNVMHALVSVAGSQSCFCKPCAGRSMKNVY